MSITPYIIAAVSFPLLLSLIVALVTHRGRQDFASFVLGGRDIPRGHYVATLTASNAALANILFLYVYWGYVYGIWAWVWGSVFWGVGFWVFSRVAKMPRFAEVSATTRPECSFNELMGSEYGSARVAVACAVVSALAFLFLLTLELNVGAKIFAGLAAQPDDTTPYLLALAIGSVLAAYAAYGGMKTVLDTDLVQLVLIIAGSVALFFLVGRLSTTISVGGLIAASAQKDPVFALSWSYIPFVLGSLFSWGFWFLCTMDMWQRTIATRIERPVLGLKAILPSFLLLIAITLSGVLVGMFLKHTTGAPFPPKYPLVDFLHTAFAAAGNDTVTLVLLSIVVCGFTAAMLSTVDTYLLIVSQSVVADAPSSKRGFAHKRILNSPDADAKLRRRVQGFTALIPFLSVLVFFLLNRIAAQDTFTLYMIAGSLPLAALPIAIGALRISDTGRRVALAKSASVWALIAAGVSVAANLFLARYALASYSAVAFGLLYFTPLVTAAIAAVPFLKTTRQ